jgi:2-dehydro-3-deoxy-D-arabinonate dehydratase
MQLCKVQLKTGETAVGLLVEAGIQLLHLHENTGIRTLSDLLHADEPVKRALELSRNSDRLAVEEATLLPPVDQQEIWGAGVTYERSREARERESVGAARFYDQVYSAERPELFFKGPARRAVGPGGAVRIRRDSRWSVPEPELALVVSPKMKIVGYTIGNDMSSRDIEGENPLYLPQAKIYDGSCALGPAITLAESMPPLEDVSISMKIARGGATVFDGSTRLARMKRNCTELISWLSRENTFPDGLVLLTGTGIVPPDDFTLAVDDWVSIEITGIGQLGNRVA